MAEAQALFREAGYAQEASVLQGAVLEVVPFPRPSQHEPDLCDGWHAEADLRSRVAGLGEAASRLEEGGIGALRAWTTAFF